MVADHADAERRDPVELAGEYVAWQPVGGDPVPHHPAGLITRITDLDLVPEPGQVVGGREPTRAGADHEDPRATAAGGGVEPHPCSSARSPRNRSTEWIETALSSSARLQTLSHGW